MFKIGDFSRLNRISVKALRYYEDIGLLKPVKVDEFSGYRYYSAEQLPRLNQIAAFKELGLSLEEISEILNNSLTTLQIKDLFILKRAELRLKVSQEQDRLKRVEKLLEQIEMEGIMSNYQVVVKKVQPQIVASMRGILPTYADVGQFYGEIFKHLGKKFIFKPAGPTILICYDGEYKEKDVDVEVVVPIKKLVSSSENVKVYELPGLEETASTIYKGSYESIGEAYSTLMTWIQNNGYTVDGPDREIYLASPYDTKDPSQYVTEVQFPIKKAG
jgi:effector-binding domain-containing protein